VPPRNPLRVQKLVTAMTRSAWWNGSGFRTTALTTLKIAVVAPIPRASVRSGQRERGLAEKAANSVADVLKDCFHS